DRVDRLGVGGLILRGRLNDLRLGSDLDAVLVEGVDRVPVAQMATVAPLLVVKVWAGDVSGSAHLSDRLPSHDAVACLDEGLADVSIELTASARTVDDQETARVTLARDRVPVVLSRTSVADHTNNATVGSNDDRTGDVGDVDSAVEVLTGSGDGMSPVTVVAGEATLSRTHKVGCSHDWRSFLDGFRSASPGHHIRVSPGRLSTRGLGSNLSSP